LLVFLACCLIGAVNGARYSKDVIQALSLAGENSRELKKALDYYRKKPADSLKYKAACFLIANMSCHNSRMYYWIDSIGNRVPFDEFSYPDFKSAVAAFKKISLKNKLKPQVYINDDLHNMTADYLIENIEEAFALKSKPWARYLTFNQFCEYLLPYRFLDEAYSEWRKSYYTIYGLMAAPHGTKTIRDLSAVMGDSLRNNFYNEYDANASSAEPVLLSPKQLIFRNQGGCADIANWAGYVFRSLGVGTAIDFTPAWAASTGSHYWNVTFGEHGETIPFFIKSGDSPIRFYLNTEPSKVLRVTYSIQKKTLAAQLPAEEIPEGHMRLKNYLDITRDYWMVSNMSVALDSKVGKVAYISVLNGLTWRPVWWGWINKNEVTFNDLTCGVVYLPMLFQKGRLTPVAYPHLLRPNNRVEVLKPNMNRLQTIRLTEQKKYLIFRLGKKYTLYVWMNNNWTSVGVKTATDLMPLVFNQVPTNALFLLVPEYSGGKERPFTITPNGEREWW